MAILVVDDEDNTRETLREILVSLGYKTILEARSGVEALKVLDQKKNKIQLILSDLDMPEMNGLSLLKNVSDRPELALAPFLLISSEVPSKNADLNLQLPRLDYSLRKPFAAESLRDAINCAFVARSRTRSAVAYIGELPKELTDATPYKEMVRLGSPEDVEPFLKQNPLKLGAVLIEPDAYKNWKTDWISDWKKTQFGTSTLIVCLGADPEIPLTIKLRADIFAQKPATAEQWQLLLKQCFQKASNAWEQELLARDLKHSLHEKGFKRAVMIAKQMIKVDPLDFEAYVALGEIAVSQGDRKKALQDFNTARSLNPFAPTVYLKLFDAIDDKKVLCELAEEVQKYCSGQADVLLKAMDTLIRAGFSQQALGIAERILKIKPGHVRALEFLNSKLAKSS